MSEMESVNILPGPHGEKLWVSLEEIESNEPLLEGCAGNERRAGVIKRARAGLAERGCDKKAEYARVLELLDMLTPTSNYETWCKLRDELVRLKDKAAHRVGPECDLVRSDTLGSIRRDAELVPKLRKECALFLKDRDSRLYGFERHLSDMMRGVDDDAKRGERTRRCIVDMARFDSGVDDGLVLRVIISMYVEAGMYEEAYDVCEDIVKFDDADDKARMAASTLVESVIDGVLVRLSESYVPDRDDSLIQKCIDLLLQRSKDLKLNQNTMQGTKLYEASNLALNIRARRRLRTAEEIDAWISQRYPVSYEFLQLNGKKIRRMLETSSRLVENISAHMTYDELARSRQQSHGQESVLGELEHLLSRMHEEGIDTRQSFKNWKGSMRGDALWDALSELRIYLRLRLTGIDVELHPPIENGDRTDLRVDGCYMEVLSPGDGTLLLSRQTLDEAELVEHALEKIMDKGQLESVGDRTMVIIMDCSRAVFGNQKLHSRLSSSIVERQQLAGVFLVLFEGDHYRSHFVKNPSASNPVLPETVDTVAKALGVRT